MKDWISIARATGLKEADPKVLAPLDTLEKTFRPMVSRLTPGDDIAVNYASTLEEEA